ncbi:MAG: ETX/MTX2 family pore-forming toxin [Bacteroidota bacterium]
MATTETDLDAAIADLIAQIDASLKLQGAKGKRTEHQDIQATLIEFEYGELDPVSTPKSVNHLSYNNDTSKSVQAKFPTQTTSTTATFEYSFTEGFKFGAKETFEVGVPEIADAKAEISFELSFSATQKVVKTVTESWTYDEPIPVPERSKVCAFLLINQDSYDPPFSGKIRVSGTVAVTYRFEESDDSRTWEAREDLGAFLKANAAKYPNVTFETESETVVAVISIGGTFKGVSGSNIRIDVTQYPVGTPCPDTYSSLAGPGVTD